MASKGINKVILVQLYEAGNSIPQVANLTGLHRSTVRHHLKKSGVLRSRAEGVSVAASQGRLGSGVRGKKRVFTDQWKKNISQARLSFSERNSAGVSLKPSGYIEITRGDNKGRGQHRVVAEEIIGRPLAPNEVVHHIDENRSNNHPSNLQVMTRSEHCRHHAIESAGSRNRDNQGRFA